MELVMNSQPAGRSPPCAFGIIICSFLPVYPFQPFAWASPQQQICPESQQGPTICEGPRFPSACFICRPEAYSRTVAEKSHLLHSMAAVSGQCLSAACTPTSCAPTGLFRKSWADTEPFVSLLCSPLLMLQQKKKKKEIERERQREQMPLFFCPLRKH